MIINTLGKSMNNQNELYAYCAGLFDGEGWFRINRIPGHFSRMKNKWAFQCEAAIQMREKDLIELFLQNFGGTIREYKPKNKNHSITYKWRCSGPTAQNFAQTILPWLRGKTKQAKLLIEFQEQKNLNGNQPISPQRYCFYEKCFTTFSALNKKGIGKKSTTK
jgi:hypothetical protein